MGKMWLWLLDLINIHIVRIPHIDAWNHKKALKSKIFLKKYFNDIKKPKPRDH